MMLQKRIDRAMDWLKKQNKSEVDDSNEELEKDEEYVELEKNDILALFISSLLVFGPIVLVLIGIIIWAYKL